MPHERVPMLIPASRTEPRMLAHLQVKTSKETSAPKRVYFSNGIGYVSVLSVDFKSTMHCVA